MSGAAIGSVNVFRKIENNRNVNLECQVQH